MIGYAINGYKRNNWKSGDNIPQYSFWKAFPSLVTAGCKISYEYIHGKVGGSGGGGDDTAALVEDNDNDE